ncbi:hypothetical protein [Limosilactobacillus ingluviei]|uniref:Uncharacterized protein n=1 Tax=Limosilactobacillus ingluviei DSM 15946 TaxID=1423760 RepID=A0A0R1UEC7_9LACO|nr:hypothetical protein [Limosilactobacillus ingluviei]KRL91662.1 hypothetical protein FC43_GL001082 [Limosilactobacillus ingluviei DSM 15946]
MTENINVIEVINEKSNGRGLLYNEVGEFDTREELIGLLKDIGLEFIGLELNGNELNELINEEYYVVDGQETDALIIDKGRKKKFLLGEYEAIWTLFGDYCKHLIKDTSTNNFLFGFEAFWLAAY